MPILRVRDAGPDLRASTSRWFRDNAARLSLEASLDRVAAAYADGERELNDFLRPRASSVPWARYKLMYTKFLLLILVGAALAASAVSPALAQAGTASPSSQTATATQPTTSTTQSLVWSPWCCAALRQAAIWARWHYEASRVRFQNAASWLQQTRNALAACRAPWYYYYWGPVWFGSPGRYAWVPYWPHRCWQQVIAHRQAIWRYTAARTRMVRAYYDWRWAQRRYFMCLQFQRWPSYYGLSMTEAMSPAARTSPAGATSLLAPSGSPDSK